MQETRTLTRAELYDILRTLEVMSRVEAQSEAFNNHNTVEILGFEEEVA